MNIEFKDISFSYPNTEAGALCDINMEIAPGECIALIGPSGCGKTTLTRFINKLIPGFYSGTYSGSVTAFGKEIKDIESYKLSKYVGSVFQNPRTQFFNMDTDSELAFGLENEGLPTLEINKRIDEVAKELKIEALRDRDIFKLSGGEKQRIAFASVYALSPDIYVLDEPSANLDKEGIEGLRECIKKVISEGKTVIIAEHRLYYLSDIITRAVYLNSGKIEAVFSKEELNNLSVDRLHSLGLRNTKYVGCNVKRINNQSLKGPGLSVSGLSVKRNNTSIFSDLNVSFMRGKVYAVIGKNGAGKSTFLRTISGLNKKYEGKISLDSITLTKKQLQEKTYMVMQDVNYQLFSDSVINECSLGIKNPDIIKIKETLSLMGLSQFKDRHPNTLSGGQKQRLAISVSLLMDKEILLFDEPTSGLDYQNMLLTAKLIRKLSSLNKIVIVVTHDEEFINEVCDEVFEIK